MGGFDHLTLPKNQSGVMNIEIIPCFRIESSEKINCYHEASQVFKLKCGKEACDCFCFITFFSKLGKIFARPAFHCNKGDCNLDFGIFVMDFLLQLSLDGVYRNTIF